MQNEIPARGPRLHSAFIIRHAAFPSRGFTLTELLIVIGIIVLVAILAVPAFRTLTGARSTESAQNQLSGLLGRARAEAIGLQEIHGVAFFRDPESQRVKAMMVRQAQRPATPVTPAFTVDVYLDAIPDRDPILLPIGVGLHTVDNHAVTAAANPALSTRADDAYLGFNTSAVNGIDFTYGGVILFDGYGRIVNRVYAFKFYTETFVGTVLTKRHSEMAKAYELTASSASLVDFVPPALAANPGGEPLRSQVGFVVFDERTFSELDFSNADPQIAGGTYTDHATLDASRSPEAREERWIDANATPVLVNRTNGTLVRGE